MFGRIASCGTLRFAPCRLALAGCGPWLVAFWHCGTLGFAPSRLRSGWAWSMFGRIFALWACISLHFGLVGVHFLTFWPCRLSFPCLLAAWAFISLYIPPPQDAKDGPFSYNPHEGFISANDETHGPRWSFGPKHKRSSIIPRAPADVLPPSTNDLRSYPERPLTFCLQAQSIFDHTHIAPADVFARSTDDPRSYPWPLSVCWPPPGRRGPPPRHHIETLGTKPLLCRVVWGGMPAPRRER